MSQSALARFKTEGIFSMNLTLYSFSTSVFQEYYSDPKRLTFVEALYILSTKAQLGSGLPSKISRPWLIADHPEEEKVNR